MNSIYRYLFAFAIFMLPAVANGRELIVKSFELDPTDISARVHPRIDRNNMACALVIAELPVKDVKFSGNVVGDTEYKTNEYWIYMTQGTKKLKIQCPDVATIMLEMPEYGVPSLDAAQTYRLKFELPDEIVKSEIRGKLNGHEWVDLGLPSGTKWATCNVGASKPSGVGNYYAWGEVKTKKYYTHDNYEYDGESIDDIAGYEKMDAARANWGEGWCIPNRSDAYELMQYCTYEWKYLDNKYGCELTGPNGQTIFFPTTGCEQAYHRVSTENGYYRLSTQMIEILDPWLEHCDTFFFRPDNQPEKTKWSRCYGFPIRPVCH